MMIYLAPLGRSTPRPACRCGMVAVYVLRDGADTRGFHCRSHGWLAIGALRSAAGKR